MEYDALYRGSCASEEHAFSIFRGKLGQLVKVADYIDLLGEKTVTEYGKGL
jgi:hypothetical protein